MAQNKRVFGFLVSVVVIIALIGIIFASITPDPTVVEVTRDVPQERIFGEK